MTAKRLFVGRKTCEDRFTIITDYEGEIGVKENRSGDVLVLKHSDLNAQEFVAQLVVFLNDQNQAIVDLFDGSKYWSDKATEKIKELEKENEELKSFNQDLSENLSVCADKRLAQGEYLTKLNNENEQLKKDREELFIRERDTKNNWRELKQENEQLKKALWCIRKRYGYTVEEFIEDLKDNGIDLTKVDLE